MLCGKQWSLIINMSIVASDYLGLKEVSLHTNQKVIISGKVLNTLERQVSPTH